MRKFIITLALAAMSSLAFAQGFTPMMPTGPSEDTYSKLFADVNYVGDGLESHNMDIYLPKNVENPKMIILIYGSAWFSNNAKMAPMTSIGIPLLEAGFAVATINHRASMEAKWPAQIQDVKAAIRYVRANADKYGYDNSFIGITGFSSGGHLSTVAATSSGVKTWQRGTSKEYDLEGNLGKYLDQSSAVQCACDWSGPNDLLHMTCDNFKPMSMGGQTPEESVMGLSFADHQDDFAALSAPTYIDKKDVPIIIFHGLQDNVVPSCVSEILFFALKDAGVKTELTLEPEGGHGMGMYSQENLDKMINFVNDVKAASSNGKEAKKSKK